MSIYSIIEKLRADSSRNYKMEVLAQNKDDELFKRVLIAALEPRINYYIKKIPKYTPQDSSNVKRLDGTSGLSLKSGMAVLSAIANRDITGGEAIKSLTRVLESLNSEDAKVIELIIQRDLKCGVNVSTINKVFPKLISETPYMRCSLVRDMKGIPTPEKPYISQVKADGSFVYLTIKGEDQSVELMTRNGNVYPNKPFQKLIQEVLQFPLPANNVYHGEFLVEQNGTILPRELGNGMLNSVMQGDTFEPGCVPVIVLWDVTPLHLFDTDTVDTTGYRDRWDYLSTIINQKPEQTAIRLIETRVVTSMAQAYEHYNYCLERGLEGTILKQGDAVWKDGTSKQVFKLKLEVDVDLKIVGFTEGSGKNADTFGAIICETDEGDLRVGVSGFTDKERKMIHEKRNELQGKIITVKSNNLMETDGKYSLFLPRYVEIRNDKTEADTIVEVINQFSSAVKGVKV